MKDAGHFPRDNTSRGNSFLIVILVLVVFLILFLLFMGTKTLDWITFVPAKDVVKFGNKNGDPVLILVDGTLAGVAKNDEPFKEDGSASVDIGEWTTPNGGRGEVIAFDEKRLPTILENVDWKVGPTQVTVNLQPERLIKVYFWVVSGDFSKQRDHIINSVTDTNALFQSERLGIRINANNIPGDVCGNPCDKTGVGNGSQFEDFACSDDQTAIVTSIGYMKDPYPSGNDIINVYYVGTVALGDRPGKDTTYGTACRAKDPLILGLGRDSSTILLAHEIGHALSLDHTDGFDTGSPPEFGDENVMHPESSVRTYLTEGQTFRAAANKGSVLAKMYHQEQQSLSHQRDCLDFIGDYGREIWVPQIMRDECPVLQKRRWQDGTRNPN